MYLGIQIWNVFGHGSHLHFFVVVDDVVLRCRCRWWFIKSCHLHISVTQEWLFGELETKFHFSADCLRVEGTHTRPLVRLVVVRCQNCTLTAAKPSPGQGFVKTIFQKMILILQLQSPPDLFLQHFNTYQLHTHIITLQSIILFP